MNEILPIARWTGGPSSDRIAAIFRLTRTDSADSYYRQSECEGWRRLRTSEDYARLNKALDNLTDEIVPGRGQSPLSSRVWAHCLR